jgi:pimeloyl-ACP methyl ester carboxylesterase
VSRPVTTAEFDLRLPSGRLHAQRFGPAGAPAALAIHGLSANMHGFDVIGRKLADSGLQLVAFDLRGRGQSDVTEPGTYGLAAHARDIVAVADAFELERFAVIGWSLGALIGMHVARIAGPRLTHFVLVDHAGHPDAAAVETIRAGLDRLDAVAPSEEAYLGAIRAAGLATPWDDHWERYYRYELRAADGGFTPRTSKAAALEDLDKAGREFERDLWSAITMPALLVRATVPLPGGLIVPDDEARAIRAAVPQLELIEIDRNHYGVVTSPVATAAIAAFLTS